MEPSLHDMSAGIHNSNSQVVYNQQQQNSTNVTTNHRKRPSTSLQDTFRRKLAMGSLKTREFQNPRRGLPHLIKKNLGSESDTGNPGTQRGVSASYASLPHHSQRSRVCGASLQISPHGNGYGASSHRSQKTSWKQRRDSKSSLQWNGLFEERRHDFLKKSQRNLLTTVSHARRDSTFASGSMPGSEPSPGLAANQKDQQHTNGKEYDVSALLSQQKRPKRDYDSLLRKLAQYSPVRQRPPSPPSPVPFTPTPRASSKSTDTRKSTVPSFGLNMGKLRVSRIESNAAHKVLVRMPQSSRVSQKKKESRASLSERTPSTHSTTPKRPPASAPSRRYSAADYQEQVEMQSIASSTTPSHQDPLPLGSYQQKHSFQSPYSPQSKSIASSRVDLESTSEMDAPTNSSAEDNTEKLKRRFSASHIPTPARASSYHKHIMNQLHLEQETPSQPVYHRFTPRRPSSVPSTSRRLKKYQSSPSASGVAESTTDSIESPQLPPSASPPQRRSSANPRDRHKKAARKSTTRRKPTKVDKASRMFRSQVLPKHGVTDLFPSTMARRMSKLNQRLNPASRRLVIPSQNNNLSMDLTQLAISDAEQERKSAAENESK